MTAALVPVAEAVEGGAAKKMAGKAAGRATAGKTAARKGAGKARTGAPAPSPAGGGQSLAGEQDPAKIRAELDRRRDQAAAGPTEPAAKAPSVTKKAMESSPPGMAATAAGAPVRALGTAADNAAVQAGGGFLLGVFAWAVGLAYLRGGAPEVRRFFNAKFFNKDLAGKPL